MYRFLAVLVLILGLCVVGVSARSDDLDSQTDSSSSQASELQKLFESRLSFAEKDCARKLDDFELGRTSAETAVQANVRWLHAALRANATDAGIEYDLRAARIESIAAKHVETGVCTAKDVLRAKAVRLDALLKDCLPNARYIVQRSRE